MEFHLHGEKGDVSRYVLCPGSQSRAHLIAEHFDNAKVVSDDRGIVVISGEYKGCFMTSCGTGMGGPAVGIATEELAHLGADTFIRVGSCGVFQDDQTVGDILIASGTYRAGGTTLDYLPLPFPAVPTFEITRALVDSAARLNIAVRVGVGWAGDGFYGTLRGEEFETVRKAGGVFIEMESDTLFVIGAVRGWRTGGIFVSDGTNKEIKPEWGREAFARGQADVIRVALEAMLAIAEGDKAA